MEKHTAPPPDVCCMYVNEWKRSFFHLKKFARIILSTIVYAIVCIWLGKGLSTVGITCVQSHWYLCSIKYFNLNRLRDMSKTTKHTSPEKQGQEMSLTFKSHLLSFTELVVCIYKFSDHWLQKFLKFPLFPHFLIEKPKLLNLTFP